MTGAGYIMNVHGCISSTTHTSETAAREAKAAITAPAHLLSN